LSPEIATFISIHIPFFITDYDVCLHLLIPQYYYYYSCSALLHVLGL
jgi:hypothetical protein